jgi:HlyD family secretion protein
MFRGNMQSQARSKPVPGRDCAVGFQPDGPTSVRLAVRLRLRFLEVALPISGAAVVFGWRRRRVDLYSKAPARTLSSAGLSLASPRSWQAAVIALGRRCAAVIFPRTLPAVMGASKGPKLIFRPRSPGESEKSWLTRVTLSKPIKSLPAWNDRASVQQANAAVNVATAQVAAAEAAISAANSQVVDAEAEVEAVRATLDRIQADIDDSSLRSPRDGRVQFRVAQLGEVLAAGGRVLNMVDLADVHMTFFLPTRQAGRVALGSEVRLVLDAFPQFVVPAKVSFVANVAQFTPRTVETQAERERLMFRIRARIDPELLKKHITQVKTGLPGVAFVRLDARLDWPPHLQVRLPQ